MRYTHKMWKCLPGKQFDMFTYDAPEMRTWFYKMCHKIYEMDGNECNEMRKYIGTLLIENAI